MGILKIIVAICFAMLLAALSVVGIISWAENINKSSWWKSFLSLFINVGLAYTAWIVFISLGLFSPEYKDIIPLPFYHIAPALLLGAISLGMTQFCFDMLKELYPEIFKKAKEKLNGI